MAYVVYTSIDDAKEAVNKLNNSTLNEKIIKVKLTRQRDNDEVKTEDKSQESLDQEKKNNSKKKKWKENNQKRGNRNGRIIIRNLSFKVKKNYITVWQLFEHFSIPLEI